MKQIKLEMEQLEVESFATVEEASGKKGTVQGREYTNQPVWECEQQSASGPIRCVCDSNPQWGTCDSCNPDWTCNEFC
jgi:hypothetical protein